MVYCVYVYVCAHLKKGKQNLKKNCWKSLKYSWICMARFACSSVQCIPVWLGPIEYWLGGVSCRGLVNEIKWLIGLQLSKLALPPRGYRQSVAKCWNDTPRAKQYTIVWLMVHVLTVLNLVLPSHALSQGLRHNHCHEYGPQMCRMGMACHNTDLSIAPMNKQTAIFQS